MTYQETLEFLFHQLPNYQNSGGKAYKPGLGNIQAFCDQLNSPQKRFSSIHIAGTNGKGSTAHMLASIYQEHGLKVGLFTSPHLKDFRERIRINGQPISEDVVVDFVSKNKDFCQQQSITFFEWCAGLAFEVFATEEVDLAIIEVGLGGRLDATNIVTPLLSVITSIGMDHMHFLGDQLEDIAKEKGGIIKKNVPLILGNIQTELIPLYAKMAEDENANLILSDQTEDLSSLCDLQGIYQRYNINTCIAACAALYGHHGQKWNLKKETVLAGLQNVVKNTGLMGRWQVINEKPLTICDTGHNPPAIQHTVNQLSNYDRPLHIVWGMVADKEHDAVMKLLPKTAHYYWCSPKNNRALSANELLQIGERHRLNGQIFASVHDALEAALLKASEQDVVFIGGSTFTVAEII